MDCDDACIEDTSSIYHTSAEVGREEALDWILKLRTVVRIVGQHASS